MELVIIAFLTLLNALFALSEVALISVKVSKLEHLVSKGSARARMALKLLKEPEGFLSSIQVGITLIGIVSGAYGGAALTDDVEKILESIHWLQPYTHEVSLFLVIGGLTYFSIAVGELVPKTIAMNNPEKIALWCAPVILYFSMFMYPFVKTLSLTTAFLLKVLRVKDKQEEKLSEEELRFLLKTAGKQGVLHKEESEVHENLFHFFDLTARGLMTPRNELEWIDRRLPKEEILERIRLSIHSKFPVCDKSLDDIVGFITVKDFLENYQQKDFILSSILREAIYFPMTMTSYNILAVFKQKK
ncbi:MAG: hypothetical protein K0R51_2552, partial [Cytophagaceae bacterium]|nr:hypothetical protein [Cytophagaceae bacterium]